MRDEDVAQRAERQLRVDELEADPVAGVDHVRHAIIDDEVRCRTRRIAGSDGGAALGAEHDEAVRAEVHLWSLRHGRAGKGGCGERGYAAADEMSAGEHGRYLRRCFGSHLERNSRYYRVCSALLKVRIGTQFINRSRGRKMLTRNG